MKVERSTKNRKQRVNPIAVSLFVVSAILFVSSLLALLWQTVMPEIPDVKSVVSDEKLLEGPQRVFQDDKDTPVIPPEPISLPMPSTDSGKTPSDRVRSDYFNDAAFVGDSITTGISIYDVMSNADVFAQTGLGLYGLLDKKFVKMDGEDITLSEAFKRTKPKKIYVMLGGNSMGNYNGTLIEPFTLFIETIARENPDSIIYIQSVLPVNEEKYQAAYKKELKNSWIEDYNQKLKELSDKNGYYYLDVASVFKNDKGEMPEEYTRDGVHIGSEQYTMWFDYLKENTAEKMKD